MDETLDIGEDRGTPIIEDYAARMPFKFDGKIEALRLSCGLKLREAGRCSDLVALWSLFRLLCSKLASATQSARIAVSGNDGEGKAGT